jgi:HAD superfamily hydrolase (TIGR01509 family)
VRERGGTWSADATRAMMGMSSREWSRYMHDELHVGLPPEEISAAVAGRLERLYRKRLPLFPGATGAVASLAAHFPIGLASSSNREIIDLVLELADLGRFFRVAVSSEEVPRGKPAPDVYLEAARQLNVPARQCVAVEDSTNGLHAAAAAGMAVIAVPNRVFPPADDALRVAAAVASSLRELPTVVADLRAPR